MVAVAPRRQSSISDCSTDFDHVIGDESPLELQPDDTMQICANLTGAAQTDAGQASIFQICLLQVAAL